MNKKISIALILIGMSISTHIPIENCLSLLETTQGFICLVCDDLLYNEDSKKCDISLGAEFDSNCGQYVKIGPEIKCSECKPGFFFTLNLKKVCRITDRILQFLYFRNQ